MANDRKYYDALIANAKPEDKQKFMFERDQALGAGAAEIQANQIDAQTKIREALRETKKELQSIFVGLSGENNPFVQIFDQGRQAIERITQATKGLGGTMAQTLIGMQTRSTANALFSQGLDSRMQALGLRTEAKDFIKGKIPTDDASFRARLSEQLREANRIPAQTAEQQRRLDKQIISLTQGIDPAKLDRGQRLQAAQARFREADRLEADEQEARKLQQELVKVLANLEKAISTGSVVRIINGDPEHATVSTKPKSSDVATYYGSQNVVSRVS
jgi:hypothetical protein